MSLRTQSRSTVIANLVVLGIVYGIVLATFPRQHIIMASTLVFVTAIVSPGIVFFLLPCVGKVHRISKTNSETILHMTVSDAENEQEHELILTAAEYQNGRARAHDYNRHLSKP